MNFFKKIYMFILVFSLLFTIYSANTIIKADSTMNNDENTLTIVCTSDSNIDLSNIEFSVYDVVPKYSNTGELIQYNHNFKFKTSLGNDNKVTFIKPSEMVYIKIDKGTLPLGYGISEISTLIDFDRDKASYKIDTIESINVSLNGEEPVVTLLSNSNQVLYANYQLSIEHLDNENGEYIAKVNTGNKELTYTYYNVSQIQYAEQNESESENVGLIIDLDNIPEYDNNSRYQILFNYNDEPSYKEQLINFVQNETKKINDFFCSESGMNLPEPSTIGNKMRITICGKDQMMEYKASKASGITIPLGDGSLSEIYINYDNIKKYGFNANSMSMLIVTLAHEYFHAILNALMAPIINNKGLDKSTIGRESQWFNEALSCAMGFVYMSETYSGFYNGYRNLESHYNVYLNNACKNKYVPMPITDEEAQENYYNLYYSLCFFIDYLYQNNNIEFFVNSIIRYLNMSEPVIFDALWEESLDEKYEKSIQILFNDFSKEILKGNKSCFFISDAVNRLVYDTYFSRDIYNYLQVINVFDFDEMLPSLTTKYMIFTKVLCSETSIYSTVELEDSTNINISRAMIPDKDSQNILSQFADVDYSADLITIVFPENTDYRYHGLVISNCGNTPKRISYSSTVKHSRIVNEDEEVTIKHLQYTQYAQYPKYYLEFYATEETFYTIKIRTIGYLNNRLSLSVLDNNYEIVNMYDGENIETTKGIERDNEYIIHLSANKRYYFEVTYYDSIAQTLNCFFTITKNTETINLNNVKRYIYEGTTGNEKNKLLKINIVGDTTYRYIFEYIGTSDNEFKFGTFINYNGIGLTNVTTFGQNNNTHIFASIFNESLDPHFLLFDLPSNIEYRITFERTIYKQLSLYTDPNPNVTVGSEVRYNYGTYQGTTVTAGFTRCIYIEPYQSVSNSRLSYYWCSSNPDVAIVSPYGTVTTKWVDTPTTVVISCTLKNSSVYVGYIELLVVPDTEEFRNINITVDTRGGSNPAGTEVTIFGGKPNARIMHIGYTRYISFVSNNPTDSYQDYIWSSSDESIAKVSIYGTITAISPGTVIITGVYKYNHNFTAQIEIRVYREFEATYN